ARCHRIGQNKAVKVYRLITRNSYEREMFDRASLKLGLDKANSLVIDTPRVRKQTRPFSATKDELAELSEGESDSDETKPKLRRNDRLNSYGRTECFRVEKNLLVYGWGRWKDVLNHGRFKKQLTEWDVESICRALLAYCLVHYRGDDKIKSFMWDLIAPSEDGRTKELQNHLGKKMKTQTSSFDIHKAEWLRKHNPEHMLQDDGYKKHLKHHCNKVLLRVRMLYYLKQEVIGSQAQKVLDGVDSSEVKIWVPDPDHSELPALWWDAVADKCLLLGVFKHGYEKYNTIRADPTLCFLDRVGRPDEKAIAAEQRGNDFMDGDVDDPEYKPAPALLKDDMEDDASSPGDLVVSDNAGDAPPVTEGQTSYWPSPSVLTARLRRLITASQRYTKSRQILHIHQTQSQSQQAMMLSAPVCPLPPTLKDTLNPKMAAKIERQQRWTRREEADFYRVVSTFGVVFDPNLGRFDWTKFRAMARLHKKTDESLQKYLCAFTAMCRRVCRLPPKDGDSAVDPSLTIQPITEERASRTLYRVELLRQVREQVLRHPLLYERLSLCQMSSDLPVWWEAGTHDRDLLIGAAKHGVSRTDYHILRDPDFCFMAAQRNYSQVKTAQQQQRTTTPLLHPQYQAASSLPTGSPLPPPNQKDPDPCGVVPKVEPASEEEEVKERQGERWSPPQPPATPTGLEEKPILVAKDIPVTSSVKGFDEDSVASLSTTQDEMQDSHVSENGVTNNSSHPFQGGGYMLAASYWPKDRVIINRLDSICQAVLKGKWPGHRRVYEPGSTVASFYTTKLLDNANSLCEDPSASPQGSKEGGLKLTFQKQGLAIKRPLEPEEGTQAQQQYLARLHELQSASDTGLADITKPQSSFQTGWGGIGQVGIIGAAAPMNSSQNPADTDTRVPVINLKDGTRLAGDDAPMRKDLDQWLREHPGFGVNKMQMQFHFQDGRPKQKRHRCRNPNKIDVNSLTGEERVQIINRRNARKGYLPESMFDRILTGPIVPEEVSRRGRRPKNPLAKAAAASSSAASALGLNPLLSNGLLSGMDLGSLQTFQQNLQSLQSLQLTAGLMGLPPDASNLAASNLAAMFPMMLSGMAGLPNLLSMSSLLGKPTQEAAGSSEEKTKGIDNSGTCEQSAPAHTSETKGERTEGLSMTPSSTSSSASSATVTQSASAASAATSHPLSLNPLLLSSMLYPGMLLTPGLNLPVSATQLQSSNGDPSTLPSAAAAAPLPSGPAASQSLLTEMEQPSGKNEEEEDEAPEGALDDEEDDDEESAEPRENSGPEGSAKAESSSSESGSSSSSSDESDSSDED
ncbi:hypothetical protein GOODEAATRI_001494, partial [Goodea atripinnis]